jgi:hypothetical protein
MDIPKNLKDSIWEYCRANDIPNINDFTIKLINTGFTIERYGATPTTKEVIVEKVVDKIIEKEVYMTDDSKQSELLVKIEELENKLKDSEIKINELNAQLENEKRKKRDIYGE